MCRPGIADLQQKKPRPIEPGLHRFNPCQSLAAVVHDAAVTLLALGILRALTRSAGGQTDGNAANMQNLSMI
jgi:hypothetical protein